MNTDERIRIGHIPARVCRHSDSGPAPTVLLVHGLGVDIGIQSAELHRLADAGFCAVGIDAVGHGQRRWPDFEARFRRDNSQAFAQILDESLDELPSLVDGLIASGLAAPEHIGMAGISMGGFITYGSALVEPRLKVLCPILGSPCWPLPARHQPEQHPQCFFPRALLSHSAALDEVVSPEQARAFHGRLQEFYHDAPERLVHVELPDSGHFVPNDAWQQLWERVIEHCRRFL